MTNSWRRFHFLINFLMVVILFFIIHSKLFFYRWLKLFIVLLYVIIDFVMAIWRREQQKVSYVAHLAGAAAGLAVGIIVLKNRKVETWEIRLKNACLVACVLIYVVFIFWNIFKDYLEEKHVLSSIPTENALQDKNINHGESYCNWPL